MQNHPEGGRADPLVDVDWLKDNFEQVKVLDATYLMPPDPEAVQQLFSQEHVPGARLFEIDRVADHSSPLPHMIPTAAALADELQALGISAEDIVVVYDRSSNHFSAPRVWKTLRAYGHKEVYVLDGGFTAWIAAGNDVQSGAAHADPTVYSMSRVGPEGIASFDDMQGIAGSEAPQAQIVDARSRGRFDGVAPEPRPGLRSGHMPSAMNLPFDELTMPSGRFADQARIRAMFEKEGLSFDRAVITTCGSGMTACVLALGLARIGIEAAIYDGSWIEWGGRDDATVAVGPARPR